VIEPIEEMFTLTGRKTACTARASAVTSRQYRIELAGSASVGSAMCGPFQSATL
jgi:hypothetical protein